MGDVPEDRGTDTEAYPADRDECLEFDMRRTPSSVGWVYSR